MVLLALAHEGYIFSIPFFLDVVAVLSLLPDTLLMDAISIDNVGAAGKGARLSRSARLGARSSRLLRLTRLVRMVRITRLLPRVLALVGFAQKRSTASALM